MHAEGLLEKYLKNEIFPQIASPPFGKIRISDLSHKIPVHIFHEENNDIRVVGKSFQYGNISLDKAWERAEKEYLNLRLVRDIYGMDKGLHRIVSPLGKNRDLSALLVIEYATGNTLDHYITNAILKSENQKLYDKLKNLALFLSKLHNSSKTEKHPSPVTAKKYLKKVLHSIHREVLTPEESQLIGKFAADWWVRESAFEDYEVIVHGDATTSNFLFHHQTVIGIDLEKMKRTDRCWDVGFIAAELKHHYILLGRNSWEAEPFVRHFLREYSASNQEADFFKSLTHRLPLYMALGLLRIARNYWLTEKHRHHLVREAILCLKYKP